MFRQKTSEDSSSSCETYNAAEMQAVFSCVQQILNKGINISPSNYVLEQSISSLLREENQRKILIIYFHNEGSRFSEDFCGEISKRNVKILLERSFILHPFDIGADEFREATLRTLTKNSIKDGLSSFVQRGEASAFFYCRYELTGFRLLSVLKEVQNLEEVLGAISKLRYRESTSLDQEISLTMDTASITSKVKDSPVREFQQTMFNAKGNDYDSYEAYELDNLKKKICFALFGEPKTEEGYSVKEKKEGDNIYSQILEENDFSEYINQVTMSIIYNCLVPLKQVDPADFSAVPVFILRKCFGAENPCRVIIDHTSRVYESWLDYLKDNKLPQCIMWYPKDGRYEGKCRVDLEYTKSPACELEKKILKATDATTAVAGIGSSGVMIAATLPAITVAPMVLLGAAAVGVGVGAYAIGRSIATLIDRDKHKESLSVKNAEARGAYLNIAAGAAGFVGAGANAAISTMAARGATIGTATRITANSIGVANMGIGGVAVGNSVFDVVHRWVVDDEKPSPLTMLQLSTSILFFGHAVYNFKTAGAIIEESQSNMLKNYKESLRSNRHRKMFKKLELETIRQNGGISERGRSEVISSIRNIPNKDEVWAFLTRNNKKFNEMGMKFFANDGKILLNGTPLDLNVMSDLSQAKTIGFFVDLPQGKTKNTLSINKNFMSVSNFLLKMGMQSDPLREMLMNVLDQMMKNLLGDNKGLVDAIGWMGVLLSFIKKCVDKLQEAFENDDPLHPCKNLFMNLIDLNEIERALIFTEKICRDIEYGFTNSRQSPIINDLLQHIEAFIPLKLYDIEEQKKNKARLHERERRHQKVKCHKCSGFYWR